MPKMLWFVEYALDESAKPKIHQPEGAAPEHNVHSLSLSLRVHRAFYRSSNELESNDHPMYRNGIPVRVSEHDLMQLHIWANAIAATETSSSSQAEQSKDETPIEGPLRRTMIEKCVSMRNVSADTCHNDGFRSDGDWRGMAGNVECIVSQTKGWWCWCEMRILPHNNKKSVEQWFLQIIIHLKHASCSFCCRCSCCSSVFEFSTPFVRTNWHSAQLYSTYMCVCVCHVEFFVGFSNYFFRLLFVCHFDVWSIVWGPMFARSVLLSKVKVLPWPFCSLATLKLLYSTYCGLHIWSTGILDA